MHFTQDHQWIELNGDLAVLGITAYAAEKLGDILEVTQPAAGRLLSAGETMARVEGVNAGADLAAPVDGEVVEVNDALPDEPDLMNVGPETIGWVLKLKPADPKQVEALMDRTAYEAYLDSL
jgi:glycine cleavage system H protein